MNRSEHNTLLLAVRAILLALGLLFPLHLPYALGGAADAEKTLGWWAAPRSGLEPAEPIVVRTLWHASSSGLIPGDVIRELNGERATMDRLYAFRSGASPGDTVQLSILRNGVEHRLTVPVLVSSPSYAGYRWYRLGLATVGWLVGMGLVAWRGARAEALLLGGALLLLGPVTAPVAFTEGSIFLRAANYTWHLAGGSYRILLPLLLVLFLVRHSRRRAWATSRDVNAALCIMTVLVVALMSDGFTRPLAWSSPGFEHRIRTTIGFGAELFGMAAAIWISRDLSGVTGPVRWLAFSIWLVLVSGSLLSVTMVLAPGTPDLIEALRQVKALALAPLPIGAALYLLMPTVSGPTGDWQAREFTSAAVSVFLAALYGFAVAGAAAVALSVLGLSLGGAEVPLLAAIFIATIVFSPVLRWSRDMIDRRVFASWLALEQQAHALVHELNGDLEPHRLTLRLRNSLPRVLDVHDVRLILARELVEQWDTGDLDVPQTPRAVLERRLDADDLPEGMHVQPVRRPTGELMALLEYRLHAGRTTLAPPERAALDATVQGIAVALRNTESYFDLQKANREIEENHQVTALAVMAGGLAHEIKNPLASLKMGLYLLRRETQDTARLVRIEDDVTRIDSLVSRLLLFNGASGTASSEAVDVRQVLTAVTADLVSLARDRGLELQESYDCDNPVVRGEEAEARVLFSSVLRNAIDACEYGGRVELRVREADRDIVIEVEDDGHGIPASLRRRVFDLNFSTKPGGSGLGLALARREAERLGGHIELESKRPRGTVLRVVLPTADSAAGDLAI